MKGSNQLNQKLLSTINASGKLHMVPASLNDKYVIRFCVCRESACDQDMSKNKILCVIVINFNLNFNFNVNCQLIHFLHCLV